MNRFIITGLIILASMLLPSCQTGNNNQEKEGILPDKSNFDTIIDGKKVGLYVLSASDSFKVALTNYGARVVGIYTPDQDGDLTDVALGFDSISNYTQPYALYFGPIVGRVANRIARGHFTLEGKEYQLAINNPPNHLHGGPKGLHNVVWDVKSVSDKKLVLSYLSENMEEGYPGDLSITVTYTVTDNKEMDIDYEAKTDLATPVNLSSHTFFNLNGESDIPITNLLLKINAYGYTPVDSTLIPTGNIDSVKNTIFDFTSFKRIGKDITADNQQLKNAGGYDHNWVLNKPGGKDTMSLAATVYSPLTGIEMKLFTEEPGLQFYSGNFFDGTITVSDGHKVGYRCGFALEPQHFPDAVNQPNFPPIILYPGNTYRTKSRYVFSIRE